MVRVIFRGLLAEFGGACGDLGTFIPHVIGAITIAGLAPFGVLFGFGLTLIGSGLFYGIPMAVQPMRWRRGRHFAQRSLTSMGLRYRRQESDQFGSRRTAPGRKGNQVRS
jgi:Molybdate transporter of MFS superfamily